MVKFLAALCIFAVLAPTVFGELKCSLGTPELPTEWIDIRSDCSGAVRNQIQKEVDASFTYLAMGAYFSRDTVNRPGFAEFFFNSAKEERQHAIKLIEYLSMRGQLTDSVTDLINVPVVNKDVWSNAADALEDALKLETEVTKSIRKLIQICEKKYNDYHLVDYLTGVYLEEQLHGQRELAGKLSTLKKMATSQGALAEFLYDKEL